MSCITTHCFANDLIWANDFDLSIRKWVSTERMKIKTQFFSLILFFHLLLIFNIFNTHTNPPLSAILLYSLSDSFLLSWCLQGRVLWPFLINRLNHCLNWTAIEILCFIFKEAVPFWRDFRRECVANIFPYTFYIIYFPTKSCQKTWMIMNDNCNIITSVTTLQTTFLMIQNGKKSTDDMHNNSICINVIYNFAFHSIGLYRLADLSQGSDAFLSYA